MGLDLRLLPIDQLALPFGYSHTILNIGGLSWDLGGEIRECARRLPDGHDITAHFGSSIPDGPYKGERRYGKLVEDAYGEPCATTTAALAVECPQCGAQSGEHCWSGTRRFRQLVRGAHQPRVRLASGEDVKPSFETILRRELRKVEAEVLSDRRLK
jgi:hypothetical protein